MVEDSLDEEGEEMVADDVKKGSIPIRLVNQAKTEEQKYIEKMKVLDVADRKEASGSKVIRTKWVVTNKGTPGKPNVRARWVAQEYKWMDGPDCEHYAPTPGLDLVKGVLSHAAASGVHISMQSLSQRRSSSFLTTSTSTPGQDAAGD